MAANSSSNGNGSNGNGSTGTLEAAEPRIKPAKVAKEDSKIERITITPPKFKTLAIRIRGKSPLVMNRFPQKAIELMKEKQQAGSQAKKGTKRDPKDFEACYEGSKHVSTEGWIGIPATAFRNAAIDACRLVGYKMTFAKLTLFIEADGFEADGTPLVRFDKGEPHYCEHAVRNESGVADIRPRAMWDRGWEAVVRVRFDADQFSTSDVVNLFARVGEQVGILEGRPFSKNSAGQGWGHFEVVND